MREQKQIQLFNVHKITVKSGVLVARVRATHKGEIRIIDGEEVGGAGIDGRKIYELRMTGDKFTCTCMAYRFTKGPNGQKEPCKHIKHFFAAGQKAAA